MSGEHVDPSIFAYQLCGHVADQEGDDNADEYLVSVVDEVMQLCPAVREHFVSTLLTELCKEIARREDPKHSHAAIRLIEDIEQDWRNDT